MPPLPAGSFDVVLLLETMLAFEDKDALVREIAAALRPGGRFAFTLEEGAPLTAAERAAMPNSDTVHLTPLDELTASLERAGLSVTWLDDHSRAHRATAHALAGAYAAAQVDGLLDRPPAVGGLAGRGAGQEARARRGTGAQPSLAFLSEAATSCSAVVPEAMTNPVTKTSRSRSSDVDDASAASSPPAPASVPKKPITCIR